MKKPTKKEILKIIEFNSQILKLLPKGDSMHDMYSKMNTRLNERYELYEEFKINPYKIYSSQLKYSSGNNLDLGDYRSEDKT